MNRHDATVAKLGGRRFQPQMNWDRRRLNPPARSDSAGSLILGIFNLQSAFIPSIGG